ncbi:MAG: BamA/TamA family outer membrane protein, partial [Bacteroidales bacterium]
IRPIQAQSKGPISFLDLEPLTVRLLKSYEDNGYPFARIFLDSVSLQEGGIKATLSLDRGPLVTYDTILNRTGYRLSYAVTSRLINLFPGEPYSESKLRDASRRLAATGFLREVRPMEVGFHDSLASLFLFPERIPSNRFDGWIGLAPAGIAGRGLSFAGSLLMEFRNLLGQAEGWNLTWKRNQDRSQRMLMQASVPFLLGLPAGIAGSFDLFRQDTTYLNLTWEAGVPYHFRPNHQLYLFFRSRESRFLLKSDDSPSTALRPYKLWLTGIAWNINLLDEQQNPTTGVDIRVEASTGRKVVGEAIDPVSQSEFLADASFYVTVIPRLVLAPAIRSGLRLSNMPLDNERFRLGGYQHLRGFEEETFLADRFLTGTLEFRYLLDRQSHLLVLSDLGLVAYRQDDLWTTRRPFSLGIGGQFRTAGGVIRLLFALGATEETPMNFRSGKIHLGYVGLF